MVELTEGVNWLAVAVGTILSFLLGWLWYSPWLFANKWMEGVGIKPDGKMAMPPLIVQLIGTFLLAWVVGITAGHNALLTIILIAAAIVILVAANGMFSMKSRYAITTEAGFIAAMIVLMIIVQGIF
jgi:hypothetical protein